MILRRGVMALVVLGMATANAPASKSGHREECHRNTKGQMVCRLCWHEGGQVRCGQPRIQGG